MGEVQLQFPSLDSALAVSRVEVVSNVEVDAIKSALRWVFDELQKQQAANRQSDPAAMRKQIQDALSASKEQKAAIETLQNQQEQLLQKADKATQDLQALQHAPASAQAAPLGEGSSAGLQDWSKLQQQLQSLADSQAALAKEVAALKQSGSLSSTVADSASLSSSAPASTSSSSAATAPVSNSPTGAAGQAAASVLSPDALSSATGAAGPQATESDQHAGDMGRQLYALTAEVVVLRADLQALGKANGPTHNAAEQGGSRDASSSTTAESATAQALPSTTSPDRLPQETAGKVAEVSAALSALQQQMQDQAATVGGLADASGDLKRLLADKASLAEVQAILKAQAGPTTVQVTEGGKVDMSDLAGAVNGLGSKLAGLEALLALSQQRIADKADAAELDNLRSAINKLKAAVGDDIIPVAAAGVSGTSDAADVVPAESDNAPSASPRTAGSQRRSGGAQPRNAPSGSAPSGSAPSGNALNALPGSISARLAILERALPTANTASQSSAVQRTNTLALGVPTSSSSNAASSSNDSNLSNRIAALELCFNTLNQALPSPQLPRPQANSGNSGQPLQPSSAGPAGSAGTSSAESTSGYSAQPLQLGSAGPAGSAGAAGPTSPESAQRVQSDAAAFSHLQDQIEALKTAKADKADLEALQLRVAANAAGATLGNTKSGDNGNLSGLLDMVQKMIAGKADKDEVGAVKRLLGDKVNLADHQAAVNNLERSLAMTQAQPANARVPGSSNPAGPASPAGGPPRGAVGGTRGPGGFTPVRPGRRTLQDENQVPLSDVGVLREEFQQLKTAVEVLTNATHLMAIPTANKPSSPSTAAVDSDIPGTSDAAISAANPGTAAANPSGSTAVSTGPTAAAGTPAAVATAAAAIAGLQEKTPAEGGAGHRGRPGGQSHLMTGLANHKQATANATEQRSTAEPGAPAATPRAVPTPNGLPYPTGDVGSSPVGLQGAAGLNGSGPLQELMTHMESGQLGHKMNDSDIHDQLAQRLAALERLVKKLTQQLAGGAAHNSQGTPGGAKDRPDERLLRRLGSDLAVLKKRVDELAPPKEGAALMMRDGDHAMLAAKPLQGYRCMACDRPLAKLDPDMGGFIPAAPMTVSVAMDVSKNNGIVVVKDAAGKQQARKAGAVTAQHSKTSIFPGPPHTGEDAVGPQNWFKEAHGQPAEALPREDVGPHLPPGGWRAGAPQSRASPRNPSKTSGGARMADEEELAAWESQSTVPLPDIHARK